MSLRGRLIAPYQREGVSWLLTRELTTKGPKGGFLCDEMGLGKTIQLIATMLANPQKRTLIIVPKSIVTQWHEEIAKFAPSLRVFIFDGPDRTRDPRDLEPYDVVLAPYSVLLENKGDTILHQLNWSRQILDEGHEIRTLRTKRHKAAASIRSQIHWVVSGTPIYNSMKDFVALCSFVGLSKAHVQAKTKEIREIYVLRRTKEDVAKFNQRLELPPCDFQNVIVQLSPEEKTLYEAVETDCRERLKALIAVSENIGMHAMFFLECLLRIRQVMIHPQLYLNGIAKKSGYETPDHWDHKTTKMDRLMALMEEHQNEKTLIFCQFIQEMDIIEEKLEGKPVFRIDGSVEKDARVQQVKGFQATGGEAYFLIQIKAGGQGLNLQAATRVYITAPSWNPATELQAIARSHRTGQTQKVYVKKLVGELDADFKGVEDWIVEKQEHKSVICAEVLNDPRLAKQLPTRVNPTMNDIRKIFRV